MVANKLAVAIHERSAAAMVDALLAAEAAGIHSAWLTTGAGPDALTVFAAGAVRTTNIHMGTAIVPTFPRHPLVVAQQALDLVSLAPGRFTLGLGPSHAAVMEGRYGIAYQRPLEHLREFVQVVHSLLSGEQVDHAGKQYNVHAKLFQSADVPIIISALRAPSFELAGEISAGGVSWLCPARYLRDVGRPALERGSARRGGPAARLIGHAFVALTSDRAEIAAGVAEYLPVYPRLTNYQEMFAAAGHPEARQGTWSNGMLDAVLLTGDEETCARKVREFLSMSGSDELILSIMPTGADRSASLRRAMQWIGKLD